MTDFERTGPTDLSTAPLGRSNGLDEYESSESLLRHYWRVLLRRRWIILGVVAVCVALGILLSLLSQQKYSASVTLEIAREAAKIIDIEDASPRPGVDQEFYQTQYTLLRSRTLADAVVRDLKLADNDAFLTGFSGDIDSLAGLTRKQREGLAAGIIQKNLVVDPVRLSAIVNLRYTSPDAATAAKVANSLATNFIKSNLTRRYDASSYARDFLESRLKQTRARLEESERAAVNYASREGLIDVSPRQRGANGNETEGQSLESANLSALNQLLAEARARRIAAEASYRESVRSGAANASGAVDNATLAGLRQQRATASAQLSRESANFGDAYPTVVALRAQVADLDRQIGGEVARFGQSVQGSYRQAAAAESELSSRVDQLKLGVTDNRRRSIQYGIFQREVDTNRALYDALLQRYKEIGVAGGIGTNNISIVDPADPPARPFSPNLRLNLLLALVAGLALGIAAALIMEQLAEAAIMPEEFQRKLGLPLLGSVPVMAGDAPPVTVLQDRRAPAAEAYFSVVTNLRFSSVHGVPKIMSITSTQPGEGKSTTAYALALSLARGGAKVVLVDGDLRNPSVHKQFGVDHERGFSNVLIGDATFDQVLHTSPIENLAFVSAGPLPPNPVELLSSDLRATLETLQPRFDIIIVDGPPVMGIADAPIVASAMDATVFVLESGRTRATQARYALARLRTVQSNVVGAILTKFDVRREGYGYGYGYDYDYAADRKG